MVDAYKRFFRGMNNEEYDGRPNENEGNDQTEVTFGFSILDEEKDVTMKNISPSVLPHFHGMPTEDPDSFLFEFYILCKIYNYVNDAQKLKLFPATLKDSTLRWFMRLGEYTIRSSDEMKIVFLKKYHEYCRSKYYHNDIFKMQQKQEEILEDYVERFMYNLQKPRQNALNQTTIKTLFLKTIFKEYVDVLNLMALGDVSQK